MQSIVLAIVIAVLGGVAKLAQTYIQTKFTPQRLAHVTDIARIAVAAAEKLGEDAGAVGAVKLQYASDLVVAGAHRFGLKLSRDEVLGFVHAALREMEQIAAYAR